MNCEQSEIIAYFLAITLVAIAVGRVVGGWI